MDHLWGHGKEYISANRQYASIEEQVDRSTGSLAALTPQEALRMAGVLSKGFWLKRSL